MTQTSATCLKRNTSGFTLVEIMVVLLIIGLAASVLSPAMQGMANSIQARVEFLEVKRKLQALSSHAIQRGEKVDASSLELQEGWEVTGDVSYHPNGVCIGGEIRIAYKQTEFHKQELVPPFCRLDDANGD